MKIKTVQSIRHIRGMRVLLRVDLNVPIFRGHLESSDLWKVRASLPTVEYLRERGARVILVSHFKRPAGKKDPKLSLKPVVSKLSQLLSYKVAVWDKPLSRCLKLTESLNDGDVVCLENIRFHMGEERNDTAFARQLAALADVYVNDAFGVIDDEHASTYGVTRYLDSFAGFLLQREIKHLYRLLDRAPRPIVAIMGGAKISSKLGLLKKMVDKVDYVLLGGGLANNVLQARGIAIGTSLVDETARLPRSVIDSDKIIVPIDGKVATTLTARARTTSVYGIAADEKLLDLGPRTIKLFEQYIQNAKTVIWNGPLGYFEAERYAKSTAEIARYLAKTHTREYVGGGETVKAVLQNRLEDSLYFVSTGGGAMLALLENPHLKSLLALKK